MPRGAGPQRRRAGSWRLGARDRLAVPVVRVSLHDVDEAATLEDRRDPLRGEPGPLSRVDAPVDRAHAVPVRLQRWELAVAPQLRLRVGQQAGEIEARLWLGGDQGPARLEHPYGFAQ